MKALIKKEFRKESKESVGARVVKSQEKPMGPLVRMGHESVVEMSRRKRDTLTRQEQFEHPILIVDIPTGVIKVDRWAEIRR